jgi:hypothetical protein
VKAKAFLVIGIGSARRRGLRSAGTTPSLLVLPVALVILTAPLVAQPSSTKAVRGAAVTVAASTSKIDIGDEVTFTARIRLDLATNIQHARNADAFPLGPRIIGWHWVSDLDNTDVTTKACASRELTCTMFVGWSGTMVFSIQIDNQLCADWVHVAATMIPELGEKDSTPRLRFDSIHKSMKTKLPTWHRCTV